MFKILGGDGKEYGPVTTDTVREWILQGRANAATLVRRPDDAEWRALSNFPELASLLPIAAAPINPSTPTSALAIWSLVLSLLGFFCLITAPVGIVLGFVALNRIKRSNGALGGRALALIGIIGGALGIVFIVLVAALTLPALGKAKTKAQSINCVNNAKQIALGVLIYSGDNNDTFPAGTNWCDAIMPSVFVPKVFQCPSQANLLRSSYSFNAALSGLNTSEVQPDTVMLFESDAGWNSSGGAALMISQPRHNQQWVIGFADGSVQLVNASKLPTLRWNPVTTNQTETPKP
jgi:hypothetical protein